MCVICCICQCWKLCTMYTFEINFVLFCSVLYSVVITRCNIHLFQNSIVRVMNSQYKKPRFSSSKFVTQTHMCINECSCIDKYRDMWKIITNIFNQNHNISKLSKEYRKCKRYYPKYSRRGHGLTVCGITCCGLSDVIVCNNPR